MSQQRILLVEDEPKVAEFLKKGLEENDFFVDVAFDGHIGRKMALGKRHNLVILDVNLPYMNGYELCKELREKNVDVPVLMLTALGTTDDKVTGFEAGADDYLIKPFEFMELLMRVKSLLKRSSGGQPVTDVLKVADLELNLDKKTVKRAGKKIDLTAKEFALLEYLMRNKGKVVSRVEIAEKIWDVTFDTGTNVIDVYVNFLRKKVDKEFDKKLIHTQIGMGYVLKDDTEE